MKWMRGVAAALLLLPAIADAQNLPMPEPGEERAAGVLMQAQGKMQEDPDESLRLVEEALVLAPRPTPFRGMIQCMRGMSMRDMPERDAQAREAFAECMLLLPNKNFAKSSYAIFLLYHDQRNEADLLQGTDLLLEVINQDARAARTVPNSLFSAVLRRLGYLGDDARIARVTEIMLKQDFLASPTQDNDSLILKSIVAALNEGNLDLAKQLVPLLKRSRSLDALSVSLAAKPLWEAVADYRKGGLGYRLADYERSTKVALEAEPIAGLSDRIVALSEGNRPKEIYSLITDHIKAASLAGNGWEDLEGGVSAATRELTSAGLAEEALSVGNAYLGALDEEQFEGVLNVAYNLGFRSIEHGHRKEGLALLEKTRRIWSRDASATEGKGGELNALALASCDTASRQANAAFDQVASQKAINPRAYEIALRCRNNVPALAAYVIDVISGKLTPEGLLQTADLRRIEAGLAKGGSTTDHALLARSDVRAALDRVSVRLKKSETI